MRIEDWKDNNFMKNLQLLCVGVCCVGESGSSFTIVVSPPPLSTSFAPGPGSASGLWLGLLPFDGDLGNGILVADLYAVTSPSPSSSALWYCGLVSRLANPLLFGDSDWCLNHPLPAFLHAGGLYDRRDLSLYSDPLLLRKPECCDGRSGTVGENSRASKSSMEALMLECESRYAWRDVMSAGRRSIQAAAVAAMLVNVLL